MKPLAGRLFVFQRAFPVGRGCRVCFCWACSGLRQGTARNGASGQSLRAPRDAFPAGWLREPPGIPVLQAGVWQHARRDSRPVKSVILRMAAVFLGGCSLFGAGKGGETGNPFPFLRTCEPAFRFPFSVFRFPAFPVFPRFRRFRRFPGRPDQSGLLSCFDGRRFPGDQKTRIECMNGLSGFLPETFYQYGS